MSYKLELAKDHQIRVVVCSPTATLPAVMTSFVEQIKTQTAFSYVQAQQFFEIAEHIPVEPVGSIVIICIQDKSEFVQALQFLTSNESRIQQGIMKVIAFNKMDHPRVLSILKSKGVGEIPEFNVNVKAFGYKIKGTVQQIEQSIENLKEQPGDTPNRAKAAARTTSTDRTTFKVQWEKPIEHFSDFWILLNHKHVRYVIGKWMINFYGPGPNAGSWEQTQLTENGENGWMFNPRVPTDTTFYKDEGRWVFFGNCPEFSWEQKIWYFISKKPSFYFYNGKDIVHKKIFFLENGNTAVSSDSEVSKSHKPTIASTIEAFIRLQTDRENKKGNIAFENELREAREMTAAIEAEEAKEIYGKFKKEVAKELESTEKTYDSAELKLNITLKNGQKIEIEDPIRLIELRETQAIFDIPVGLLVVGDNIDLVAHMQEGKKIKKLTFSAATKIVENDLNDGTKNTERAAAICELNKSIKIHFTDVVDQLQAKREVLDDFFKKAKGA
ncbi:MAG: hypothetical protein JST80_07730 [Bdellovibrionales bacterium]|nr:hypothetical protein [Bdellovibrionales bacterium]